jgi:hypothetical protein
MKRHTLIVILLSVLVLSAPCEEFDEVYAPFVSNLEATADSNRVVLTWNDSADPIWRYRIYMKEEPFTRENGGEAQLIAEVEPGVEAFSHYPDNTEARFYAVLAVDSENREYPLYIPFRNITSDPVSVSTVASLEDRATSISDINARVSGEVVYLSYTSSQPDRPVVVYRNTAPLTGSEMLASSTLVASFKNSGGSVTDFPLPGLEYYYAVLDRELLEQGAPAVRPGENSTLTPVSVTLSSVSSPSSAIRNVRTRPLPFLTLQRSVLSGEYLASYEKHSLPDYRPLSEAGEDTVMRLIRSLDHVQELNPLEPSVFTIDKSPGEVPEALLLSSIVRGTFMEREWKNAEKELANFLAIRRSENIEARAHHYMGQVYYFQKKYREAFYEFLFSREEYRKESDLWMDSTLIMLR